MISEEWCLAHPWMTFFIVLAALNAITAVAVAVRRTR